MPNHSKPQNAAQKSAQNFFQKAAQTDTSAKGVRKKERNAEAANMARLRGLRLGKEAKDKEAELAAQADPASPPAKSKREPKAKPVKMIRMIY